MLQVERLADWLDGLNSMERSQEAWRRVERNWDTSLKNRSADHIKDILSSKCGQSLYLKMLC